MKQVSTSLCILLCILCLCLGFLGMQLMTRFGLFSDRADTDPLTEKLESAVSLIREHYIEDADEKAAGDAAVAALVNSLNDRWAYYLTAEETEEYRNSLSNTYGGIGIVLSAGSDGVPRIIKVYPDSPAGRAGIPSGCTFLAVGDENVSAYDTGELSAAIRGQIADGLVTLTLRTLTGEEETYELIPGEVLQAPVSSAMLESGFGLVRIENFDARAAEDALSAVTTLREAGAAGIIFDVRKNPGGQLGELLDLLDPILPEGRLFVRRDNQGRETVDYSDADCMEFPMAVLVDANTYSAAEFFAAAMQEYGWAVIIGEQTTGKGYAQSTYDLPDGSAIHISTLAYFTPQGNCLAGVGLTPDVTVPMSVEKQLLLSYGGLDPAEDDQLQKAVKLLLESADLAA